ncbi:hypothetical protein CCB81_12305 [Armatimonadetes bacterium Uphvl-Ar2]|jgi:prepilin-type N-terminal cleavage/methylation domain-containing protein|nr:hypothetical protein CCB81_12305 [Armatimonadetes bacterium Uphvl-Ar2]
MKRHAFTLVEVLVVLAILAIVATLLFPVYSSSKNAAGKVVSYSKLKQSHLGLLLYREDNGGDNGHYGKPSLMNLPYDHWVFTDQGQYGVDWKLRSPGGCPPWEAERKVTDFIFSNLTDDSDWATDAILYEELVVVFGDISCNPRKDFLATAPRRTKTSTAVLLSGQIATRTGRGDFSRSGFYSGPSR